MDSVKWIFGDPLSGSNVSSQFHPKHQFSQAGQFQVQFILYVSCAVDTSTDTVTISPVITFNRDVEICDGQSYFVAGQLQTTAGMYYDTLSSQHACDSVVATNLIVQPNYVDTLIYSPVCQLSLFRVYTIRFCKQLVVATVYWSSRLCFSRTLIFSIPLKFAMARVIL